jgi:glutamate N-acetyltransferase/amino-acid N-acetyltransferase
MTTDTVPKIASASITIGDREVRMVGVAKGSGMIMPDMATMLCFVVSDAQIVFPSLKHALTSGVDRSFNRITVDGDTSTNDMVLIMANGAAGNDWIDEDNPEGYEIFAEALHGVLHDLAKMIVLDGEGATKLVNIRIIGARTREGARAAARTIANSALVKTAFFGEDANWGRIIAALGRSGCRIKPERIAIFFDQVCMVRDGVGLGRIAEEKATRVLKQREFTVTVDLQDGMESAEMLTCDFSYDYVKINADYRT